MIAFGIDPGSRRTGWGVIEVEGSSFRPIDHGVIEAGDRDLPIRLQTIFRGLTDALIASAPDHVFLESVFYANSAKSALVLGHARGVAMLAAALRSLPVGEVTPAEVKKAVTGRGRADKGQVQEMVRILLGLDRRVPTDASDALAIAIAGATQVRFDGLVKIGERA